MTYAGYGDEDALTPTADAVRVGRLDQLRGEGERHHLRSEPGPRGRPDVFFAFNYSAMDAAVRPQLLQNAVVWLTTPEIGNCSVSGRVLLAGQSDHSGVKVEAIPNGGTTYTNAQGDYTLPGLYAGSYTIQASKADFGTRRRPSRWRAASS